MTDAKLINLLTYGGVYLLKILLALLVAGIWSGSVYGFREGEALAGQQKEIAGVLTVLGYGLASWLEANRARIGSEGLAADVKTLQQEQGLHRSEMTVISKEDKEWLDRVRPLRDAQKAREGLERASQRG